MVFDFQVLGYWGKGKYMHHDFQIGASTAGKIVAETCACISEVLSPICMMTERTPEKWTSGADRGTAVA